MSNLAVRISSLICLAATAAACAGQPIDAAGDAELGDAVDSDTASLAAPGDPANSTFYIVTRDDFRRCASPRCSGFYVKRVNAELDAVAQRRGKTECLDGTWQADCYVSDADYGTIFGRNGRAQFAFNAKLESGAALVRASIVASSAPNRDVARLRVRQAWAARSDVAPAAGARFGRVTQPMIKCQAGTRCPSFFHTKLNVTGAQVGFGTLRFASHVDAAGEAEARAALVDNGAAGILTAGNVPTGSFGRHGVQQFYLRADVPAVTPPAPRACGSRGLSPCASDEVCVFAAGTACGALDHGGSCQPRPAACAEIYSPVCGCDGTTYGNECEAHAAGVSAARTGQCGVAGDLCGGDRLQPSNCAEGFFCSYAADAVCGFTDAGGSCAPKPDVCTFNYTPVCGCDGKTYGNACTAASAGVSVAADGACAR